MYQGLLNFSNVSNHLILIGIYAILALSLNLINGSLGAFSLGHHGFWGMGAYAASVLVWHFGSADGSLLIFAASFVVAMFASAMFGLLVGTPCLRLKGDYLAIATLGFSEIFVISMRNSESWTAFGERGLGGKAGFSSGDGYSGGNHILYSLTGSDSGEKVAFLILTWLLVLVTFIVFRNILRSGHGRAIMAIRDDETAAELMGVHLIRYKVLVFVVGAAFAGLAGALSANYRGYVCPDRFVMMEGVKILLMVVLGGLGSMSGALLAAVLLYASEQALLTVDTIVPFIGFSDNSFIIVYKPIKDLSQVGFALLLIILMLLRPHGLMGKKEFSCAFFRRTFAAWREHPLPVLVTVFQWAQFLIALPLSQDRPAILYVSLSALVACHFFKQRYKTKRALGG